MNDKYCYKNGTLINKQGITDYELLKSLEEKTTKEKLYEILINPSLIDSRNKIVLLKKIHKYLFDDFYTWAGSFRKQDIYKEEKVLSGASVFYTTYTNINIELNEILMQFDLLSNDEIDALAICDFLHKIWHVHPFRDGNTRTCTFFLKKILDKKNISFDISLLIMNGPYVRKALVLYEYDKKEYLLKIINNALINGKCNNNVYFKSLESNYKNSRK